MIFHIHYYIIVISSLESDQACQGQRIAVARMIKDSFYLVTSFRFSITGRRILKGFASKTKPACFIILVFDFFASFSEPSDTFCCTPSKVYCLIFRIEFTFNYISFFYSCFLF
nr:MAG TPA: hypothetical protein [Caudoviricetes sp.]